MQKVFSSLVCHKQKSGHQGMAALLIVTLLSILTFTAEAAPTKPRHKIMVFGDSLSAAYGISPNRGWVALLAEKLRGEPVEIINASISGETTRGGLARLPADLARHKPTLVLIELGANDALRGLPVTETRKNLEAMIASIRVAHAQPVLIGMQIPPNYGLEYASDFRALYPVLAKKFNVPLVPFLLEGIADQPEKFQADRLHPVAEAQPLLLDNVWPVLEKILKK